MEGEEAAALAAYRAARRRHPRLRLVLVPRHAERFDRVAAWLRSEGETVVRREPAGGADLAPIGANPPVVLVDTMGELSAVWGLADVAFVGGSLFPGRGGQNVMEPAAFGAAVLFGPHTENFRETVEHLLECGGGRRVADAEGAGRRPADDLDDPEAAPRGARPAAAFVLAQNGAAAGPSRELDRLVESASRENTA